MSVSQLHLWAGQGDPSISQVREINGNSHLHYVAMTPAEARDAFTRLLQTPEAELDLAEAALLIAAEEYPELRPSHYLEQIARMGSELRRRIRSQVEPRRVVETTNVYLFEELHFKGNREEYYDPRNSFLNDVLERRVGIPITLSVLYVAVGERAGLPVRGVGMPGHFLVKYAPASSGEIFIDAFNGRTLTREEARGYVWRHGEDAAGAARTIDEAADSHPHSQQSQEPVSIPR